MPGIEPGPLGTELQEVKFISDYNFFLAVQNGNMVALNDIDSS
jgi:hypothetical protein